MSNFKIKIKSKDENFFATDNDIEVLDSNGNVIKGLSELCFTARVGELPILSLSTYLTDLELDIPRENVFLSVNYPAACGELPNHNNITLSSPETPIFANVGNPPFRWNGEEADKNRALKNPFQLNIWDKSDWKSCSISDFASTGIPASFQTALLDYQNGKISDHGLVGYVSGPNGGLIPTHEFKNFVEETNSGQAAPPIKNFNIYSENGTGYMNFSHSFQPTVIPC